MEDFFKPVYLWQESTWNRLTNNYPNIAHGLLFAGKKGMGKHQFALSFTAWVLCQNKESVANNAHACGQCQSCLWLKAGTHPNYLHVTKDKDSKSDTIKVDDVRKILPFAQQSSQGTRVVFIEKAERMNVSSANALLKTLEEPPKDVLFLLTSNNAQQLLPTIHSRVQSQDVATVTTKDASQYVDEMASYQTYIKQQTQAQTQGLQATDLLNMVGGSPLPIEALLQENWISQRTTWLKVWQAMRSGQRDHITASQYWQNNLTFEQACDLQMLMCRDLLAVINDMQTIQPDIDFSILKPAVAMEKIVEINAFIHKSQQAIKQNTQISYLYDKLMLILSQC